MKTRAGIPRGKKAWETSETEGAGAAALPTPREDETLFSWYLFDHKCLAWQLRGWQRLSVREQALLWLPV